MALLLDLHLARSLVWPHHWLHHGILQLPSLLPGEGDGGDTKPAAAIGIIYGLDLGYRSCIVLVICLAITLLVAHTLGGNFGGALGALGMLGTVPMAFTIDAYGPISDNAGEIAVMSGLPEMVREITDCLDAAGNTTAAIGRGLCQRLRRLGEPFVQVFEGRHP